MPSNFKHLGKNWAIDADCEYIYVYDYKKCKYSLLSVGAIYVPAICQTLSEHALCTGYEKVNYTRKKSNMQKRQSE